NPQSAAANGGIVSRLQSARLVAAVAEAWVVRQPAGIGMCMVRIFGVLLAIFIFQASAYAAEKIRIGFPDLAVSFVSLPLGEKRGHFREEGLQAEFIRINPTVALAALVSGEMDYYTVLAPAVAAAIRGLPIKVVACYMPTSPTALIVRPEFKSVQELRGKTIGLNILGGALEVTAKLIFKHFGLDPDREIKFLANGPLESRFAAVRQGLTAGTLGSPPTDFLGKKMGFVVLARANELFSYPVSGIVASTKKIRERPDEIKRVIKAAIKANRCGTKVIMSGVNGNVIMSGCRDDNPDDERREAARDNTKSVSRGADSGGGR